MTGRRYRLAALASAGLIAGGLPACGGEEEEKPKRGADLTAVRCPAEPAEGSFDTAKLIGKRLDAARTKAAEHGCEIVVSMKDGNAVPVPVDVDPKRIYVYTERGAVTEIEGVGGGL